VNGSTDRAAADEHEALIQFLYMAPVGLVQAGLDGEIAFINPVSAQLLMPLSRDGSLTNLFTALEDVAPDLKRLAAEFPGAQGLICDGVRIPVDAGGAQKSDPKVLAVTVLKLYAQRLMAVISDITQQVRRERLRRRRPRAQRKYRPRTGDRLRCRGRARPAVFDLLSRWRHHAGPAARPPARGPQQRLESR
jgi:hypothetical protein